MQTKYRPDIDGLRAVAVLGVVAFHAFPEQMPGGFIGVDIFFVISGFLISSILLGALEGGSFSITDFYARRVRRIFPALLVVLVSCLAFGWWVLFPDEYAQLLKHIAAGAGFVSNLVLWSESGYFDNAAATKPLLHLWSLGIEEQFYVAWPLLLWIAWKVRVPRALLVGALLYASFMLNVSVIGGDPVAAFYAPHMRFWELLAGAALAVIPRRAASTARPLDRRWRRDFAALAGTALVAAGFWLITEDHRFPGYWALLPTLGTALLIAAGENTWIARTVLSNRLLVWFGLISFPLYLWHWPLLSFARIVEGATPALAVRCAAVIVSILLAWLTWRYVERPLRYPHNSRATTLWLVFAVAVVGGSGFHAYRAQAQPFMAGGGAYRENVAQFTRIDLDPAQQVHSRNCVQRYPVAEADELICLTNMTVQDARAPDVVFIGDSHAEALALGALAAPSGRSVMVMAKRGCPPLPGVERFSERGRQHCPAMISTFLAQVERGSFRDSVVVLAMRSAAYVNGEGVGEVDFGSGMRPVGVHIQFDGLREEIGNVDYGEVYVAGLQRLLVYLVPRVRTVVFTHQVPELGMAPQRCLRQLPGAGPSPCAISRADVVGRQARYRVLAATVLRDYPSVVVVDPLDTFCDADNCFGMKAGVIMYRDDDHLGIRGAALYYQAVLDSLAKAQRTGLE